MVSRGSWATIVSAAFSHSILWREMHVLTLTENMRLRTDPLSESYAEYFVRVGNGQESSIIDHFPLEADTEPLVGVEIALYLEIHQAPFLNTFIHTVFLALHKPRIHGWLRYFDNKKYNPELSQHLDCRGCARGRAHIFVSILSGNGE